MWQCSAPLPNQKLSPSLSSAPKYYTDSSLLLSVWVQVAGALAEAGVGLEEITERVSVVAKAMGECQPRDWGGEGGGGSLPWD